MRPTIDQDDDKPHEECGVFGVWNGGDAAALTALGLHALQHRGQEAAGIVTLDEKGLFHAHKGLGLVGDNFGEAKVIASLRVNTVFLGTHSVSIPRGFLMPNSLEAATDMAMMGIADRTPKRRASYDAVDTTPRPPSPPTILQIEAKSFTSRAILSIAVVMTTYGSGAASNVTSINRNEGRLMVRPECPLS